MLEKGGGTFAGVKLLLCENPLPPLDEAIVAAEAELPRSNYYTEAHSGPLRELISEQLAVPERLVHINAGSELILRQIFERLGQQVHLLTPTYSLFPDIARRYTETRLMPEENFRYDLRQLKVPKGTTLAVIVNPNNPNGATFDTAPVASIVEQHPDYAVLPEALADDLNKHNDAYPLARASQAAALATLRNEDKIRERGQMLRAWTDQLAGHLQDLGVRVFPTETYFFLADFAPLHAAELSAALRNYGILIRPLDDPRLGDGYMRVTTALPEDNVRVITALRELLSIR